MNEEDNMKLNWKFDNETKALRADGPGETLYRVLENDMAPGYLCERRDSNKQMSYASWYEEKIPSLEEAMALCQKDAEEQEKLVGAEKPSSKFPDTASAGDWVTGFVDANRKVMTGGGSAVSLIGPLTEWFKAALSCGYDKGLLDQAKYYENARAQSHEEHLRLNVERTLQETPPRSEHEAEAEGFKFPLESPDKTPAPSLEERVAWLEVAAGRAAMQLPREGDRSLGTMHEEVCARLSSLEERAKWSVDSRLLTERLDEIGTTASKAASRVEELDGVVKSGVGGYSYDARIDGFMKRLNDIGTTAAKAASRVGQLWQKQTIEMREANKRIGKLEEKWSCSSNAGLEKRLNEVEIIAKSYTYDMGWKIEKQGERLGDLQTTVQMLQRAILRLEERTGELEEPE